MNHLRSILIGGLLALGLAAAQEAPPVSVEAATWMLGATLAAGIDTVPTPGVVVVFGDLRTSVVARGDPGLQVLAQPLEAVEKAFMAEPFDASVLAKALGDLALALRVAATEGGPLLLAELASLVDQTSHLVEGEGFIPRMDVDFE